MRRITILLGIAALSLAPAHLATANGLVFGVWSRPACGKVCKLVCEEKTLTATGYACHCDTICIPGPSCKGCKHCDVTCCCDNEAATKGCPPKIEFCWYDWFSNGCAAPRQVKVLTKWQAERKICWYHWEVVDGCTCAPGGPNCGCVYKEAPAETQIGQAMSITSEERVALATWMNADAAKRSAVLADAFQQLPELQVSPQTADQQVAKTPATAEQPTATTAQAAAEEKPSMFVRFGSLFKSSK
jgi:hypothetical protein